MNKPTAERRIDNLRRIAADETVNNFARSICGEAADALAAMELRLTERRANGQRIMEAADGWKASAQHFQQKRNELERELAEAKAENAALRKLLASCSEAMQHNNMKYQVTYWTHMIDAIDAAIEGKP